MIIQGLINFTGAFSFLSKTLDIKYSEQNKMHFKIVSINILSFGHFLALPHIITSKMYN